MSCPPGQSFDNILQESLTHDQQKYTEYKALDCQSKNMFFDGTHCVSVTSQAGKDLFDDFADGVQDPQQYGNQKLFDKLVDQSSRSRRNLPCKGRNLGNTYVFGGTCYNLNELVDLLQKSFSNNEPFFVKNAFGRCYYPTVREVRDFYQHYIRNQQRRGLPVVPMPPIQVDLNFIQNHELKFFVTPYTQRFVHIAVLRKTDHIIKTVGFVPRKHPVGLPAKYKIDTLLVLIEKAFKQGRLINSAYEKRIDDLPGTSDPWNQIDANTTYIRLFKTMEHVTRFLKMPRA